MVPVVLAALLVSASVPPSGEDQESIEVAAIWTGEEQASFQRVLDAFTEQTGVEASYSPTGDDPSSVLGTRAQGGDPPDVAIVPQPGLMTDLAIRDLLEPLDEDTVAVVEENYDEAWIDLGMVGDELYGVVFKATNKSTVWFNTELFAEAGVSPPQTWDELLRTAETFEHYGVPPFSVAGADGWVLTDWFENIYLQVAGPQRYRDLAELRIRWDDPTVIEALERMSQIFRPEWLAGGTERALLTDFPTAATQPFIDEPEAAVFFEGDFTAGVIEASTDAELGREADFFPFPRIRLDETTVIGAGDMAILMTDSAPARELIRFLATPESAAIWAQAGGFLSPNRNLALDAYGDDQVVRRAAEMLQEADASFDLSDSQPAEFGATIGRGMFRILQDFLQRPDQVEQTAQALDTEAERAWRRLEEAGS
jgi:ABC-type glycerol-3-phosphate transport system substrate-binding protein